MLVHVVDCATLGAEPRPDERPRRHRGRVAALRARQQASAADRWSERTRIVVLNKADVPDARDLAEMVIKPRPRGARASRSHTSSAVAHTGLKESDLLARQARRGGAGRDGGPRRRAAARRRRPKAVDGFRVDGALAEQHPPSPRSSGSSVSGRPAGSTRPTSPTTRPSATSPTGSAASASRRTLQGRRRRRVHRRQPPTARLITSTAVPQRGIHATRDAVSLT